MSKRELERKYREEQEATAHAFQEFIKTFQDTSGPPNKLFVKAGVLNTKTGREEESESGKIYNPQMFLKANSSTLKNAIECARLVKESKVEKNRSSIKPKSNLELLKEELRLRHMERDMRSKYSKDNLKVTNTSEESTDTSTTNLFVANLNPKLTEQDLMQIFGAYGPLASVKIMWPRNDDKSRSNTNCGFVAFMSRKDAERALKELKNHEDMHVGWGNPIEIPSHPIYIPPDLVKLLLPPPYTGLPFNAQPLKQPFDYPKNDKEMQELLYKSIVKVTIPLDKKTLMLIHRTIEFVINEGPLFEAMIMNNELNNPQYQFLFDNKSPNHVYYRWKLYSLLSGDSPNNWSMKNFRMFEGGSIWIPPLAPNYTEGMPVCLINSKTNLNKKLLSDAQKNRLTQNIQHLSASRLKIGEAMIFCLNHGEAAKDIVDIISSSFDNASTKPTKKLWRLYLVSDILYNVGQKKFIHLSFRDEFTKHLNGIFENLNKTFKTLKSPSDKEAFKNRVFKVLRAWDLWKIYQNEFLNKLEMIFLGTVESESFGEESGGDEPLDGKNLLKRSLKIGYDSELIPSESECIIVKNNNTDIKPDLTKSKPKDNLELQGFITSKWETIDPEQVEAQAMSTKKFYDMELNRHKKDLKKDAFTKNKNNQEREKLRQIEVLVMQYQDELESGKRKVKKGKSLESHLEEYRSKLVHKMKRDLDYKNKLGSPISSDSSPERTSSRKDYQSKNKSTSKKKYGKDKHPRRSRS